jgi:Secretion system C-terminal sorting domain/Metallo-peptidase family M12B Reprolysin-like
MKIFKTIPIPLAAHCQRFLLSVAWLFLGAFCANAQSLVTEISSTIANLSSQEAATYQNLSQDAFTKNVKLVSIGNPTDFLDNGVIQFSLPGLTTPIIADVIDITQTTTSFGWIGKLTNQGGNIAIYEIEGQRAAWIQAGQQFFELMPIKPGVGTLREIKGDVGDVVDCVGPVQHPPSSLPINFCTPENNNCSSTIDVLVLVPPDVRTWLANRFGNNPLVIALYVGIGTYYSVNAAFINSSITNKTANIIMEQFDFIYPAPLVCKDALEGNGTYQGLNTQAAVRRAAVGADLVVLLTGKDFIECGAGRSIGNPSDGGSPAFAFVEMQWLIGPRWSFVHEVGHLLSARHDLPTDVAQGGDANACGHGFTVGDNRFQRTIMDSWSGTMTPPDTRILYFSNPDVGYNGSPTGSNPVKNNAKSIKNAACTVGGYETSNLYGATIITDSWVCTNLGFYVTTSAFVQTPPPSYPGIPPYTYEWRWNHSGDFVNDPSTMYGTTATAQFPIPSGPIIWVRLKVTSADNQVLYRYRKINIFGPGNALCHSFKGGGGSGETNFLLAPSFVAPNPAATEITLTVQSEIEKTVDLVVSNSMGSTVLTVARQSLSKGETRFQMDVSGLPVGMYTITILSESGNESLKFIINR